MASPLSIYLVALVLALPGVWLAGRAFARSIGGDAQIAPAVAPALGLSLWLLAIHIIARAKGSFSAGLVAGTLLVSLGGFLATWATRASGDRGRHREGASIPRRAWIAAAAAMLCLLPTAILWPLHDELWVLSHMSIPAQMLNDAYPPHDMFFPAFELRYHYGFDLLTAVFVALTRARLTHALDAITVVMWGYTTILIYLIGERVAGRGRGLLVAFVTLFGGGFVYLADGGFPPPLGAFVGNFEVEGLVVNPPLASYFFQHPWTLGLPLALAALLIGMNKTCRHSLRYAALGVLLTMLALSQLVLFLGFSAALLLQETFAMAGDRGATIPHFLRRARLDAGRALLMAITLAAVLTAASRMGGFFVPPYDDTGIGLVVRLGVAETLAGSVAWLALTFGLLIPLGVAGAFFIRRAHLFFISIIAGSFAILLSVRYRLTWDIVKFATLAAVSLGILAAAALSRVFSLRPAALWRPIGALALAGVTTSGLGFLFVFGLAPDHVTGFARAPLSLAPDDEMALAWLRRNMRRGEVCYRKTPVTFAYATWGGIPIPLVGNEASAFGFSNERIARRKRLMASWPADPDRYLAEGLRWLVLEPSDRRLMEHAARWQTEGRAREAATFGRLRIFEILPP